MTVRAQIGHAFALLVVAAPLMGQGVGGGVGFGLSLASIDRQWAADRGMGVNALVIQGGVDLTFARFILLGGEISGFILADKRSFSNATTGGTLESGIEMFSAAWSAGLRFPIPMGDLLVVPSARYGRMSVSAHRGISNCAGCDVQDLAVAGGGYFEGRLVVYRSVVGVGAVVRSYRDDSFFRTSFGLRVEMGGGRRITPPLATP